jgi:hypothetical protein
MIEEAFLQIGERNGPRVAAAAKTTTTTTRFPWRLPFIKHLQTRAEIATELQTWKILAQTKPNFCHIRPAPTADHRHRKNRENLLANLRQQIHDAERKKDDLPPARFFELYW